MDTLTFQPILGPWVLILIGIAAVALLMVGPSFSKLSRGRRVTLIVVRLGVVLLALLTVLRPGCVQKIEKNQAAVLMVLLDASRSMDLPHISDDSTRWSVLKKTLEENASRFSQLQENQVEVQFLQFDSESQTVESLNGAPQLPAEPAGSETDIGSAVYQAGLAVRDRRLLAVLLASDGVQNVLDPQVELIEAANSLRDREVPLVSIQLGLPGENSQLADVAVTSFAEQLVVNKKSDLLARSTIVARGYANQDIRVNLVLNDGQTERTVATQTVRPEQAYQELDVQLKYRPTEPGEYRLSVRAEPMPGELALRNNSLDGFLTVRDEGMRVLMLSGAPGWEQKALRDALPALEFVDLDFRPIYTTAEARRNWPLEELEPEFADPEKYDVFILCNVDARALYDHRNRRGPLSRLAEAVTNGKGLLMIGGTHSFDAGMYQQTPLADVLPIVMQPNAQQEFGQDTRLELHINQPVALKPTRDHFLTRIDEGGANREAWRELPPLVGANRIRPKQTAEVFLESDDEAARPMLVAGNVGGRVLAFAGDSTWRWRLAGKRSAFDQFWRQLVLWLAFWDSRDDESVSIDLPKRRFSPRSRFQFGVNVRTLSGESVTGVDFEATLLLPDGRQEPIAITAAGDQYEGEPDPELLALDGVYRIQLTARQDGELLGTSQREFVVIDQDQEKANPAANPEQLARLSNQTSEFGKRRGTFCS